VKVLLDTHTFLWWITDDPHLSMRAREVMESPDNEMFLSAASGWEIAIKASLGKLKLPDDLQGFVSEQLRINAIHVLPIQMAHALHVYTLPGHHRDPFDRLLVAQSQLEQIPILTDDPQIAQYSVTVIGI
jgi:PIN domain nuclease of toxin-antitoxin system